MKLSRAIIFSFLISCLVGVSSAFSQEEKQVAISVAGNLESKPPASPAGSNKNLFPSTDLSRVGVQTSQTLPLTLNDVVKRALENSNDIEVSRDDVRFQETQVRALLGIYDPVFTATPTFTRSSNTGSAATNDFRVNSNVTQFLERGGGNYQVFFNNSRSENAFTQAQLTSSSVGSSTSAIYSSGLGANYTQPLFRNFRYDSRRRSINIARRRLEQTQSDFESRATQIVTEAQQAYWDLVYSLRNQQNQIANVNLARENLRQVEARIEAGAAAPIQRAEVATELANREGELLSATFQVAQFENTLKQYIIRDPLSQDWSASVVPTDEPLVPAISVTLVEAMKDAMENRFELRRFKLEREINQEDIRYFKNQTKPQIDLNTAFSLNGLSRSGTSTATTTNFITGAQDLLLFNSLNSTRTALGLAPVINPSLTIPASPSYLFGGFNQSLINIFRSDAPNFSVGVTISFPFRNRTAKANLEGARIQEHQLDARVRAQEQAVISEVRIVVQSADITRQRIAIARRARENAEIQLEGERKLFEAGRSTTFLLFQRENTLTNARNAEIRAQTDYRKAVSNLQRGTATTFRENNIIITSPLLK